MSLSCPKCSSNQIQRVSLVHNAGRHSISTTTIGGAVGPGLSPAIGVAATTGTSQSLLSQQLAPPKKDQSLGSCWILILGFVAAIIASMITKTDAAFWIVIVGAFIWAFAHGKKAYDYNRQELPSLHNQWERQFLCLQCGFRFESDTAFLANSSAGPAPTHTKASDASAAAEPELLTAILSSVGPNPVSVIAEIRNSFGSSIADAKRIVEVVPSVMRTGLSRVEAESINLRFQRAGATVDFRPE